MDIVPRQYIAPDDAARLIAYHEQVWDLQELWGTWHLGDPNYFIWQTQSCSSPEFSCFHIFEHDDGKVKGFVLHQFFWNTYRLHCHPALRGTEEHVSLIRTTSYGQAAKKRGKLFL